VLVNTKNLIAIVVGVVLALLVNATAALSGEQTAESTKPKVAVLQFHNRSGDAGLDYFGIGLTEALAAILARAESAEVIPPREAWRILKSQGTLPTGGRGTWASMLAFGDAWTYFIGPADMWLDRFSRASGAQIVVAGGYFGERDCAFPIWIWKLGRAGDARCAFATLRAENPLDLLPQIAAEVLKKGDVILTPRDQEALARKSVQFIATFEQFSRGVELLAQRELGETDQTLLPRAVEFLKRATELEPNFGLAWYQLACLLHEQKDAVGARVALERFLTVEPTGALASQARRLLEEIGKQ